MSATEETGPGGCAKQSLARRLREKIKEAGTITFRDWMESALYEPVEGYYRRNDRNRWGREGDYRTSPERSPLFAATFARYFATLYENLNRPSRWTIVEMGAGSGHFAEGVLSTLRSRFPNVFAATNYVIDEISESSVAAARERLQPFNDHVEFVPLAEIPTIEKGLVFSNELLDAFPVHRVTMRDGHLGEYYVAVDEAGGFQWTIGPPSTVRLAEYLDFVGVRIGEGQIVEINLGIESWLRNIAQRLVNGYVVTVDYGAEASELSGAEASEPHRTGEHRLGTLRAFCRHQLVDDVLAAPGEQDLTTTIDWSFVKKVGERLGLETLEFERQDRFLLKAGLLEELEVSVTFSKTEAERVTLRTSAREMILPDGMAASFQVLVQKKSMESGRVPES